MGVFFMVLYNCKKRKLVSIEKVVWGFHLCFLCSPAAPLKSLLLHKSMCVCADTQPVGAGSRSELPPLFLAPEM